MSDILFSMSIWLFVFAVFFGVIGHPLFAAVVGFCSITFAITTVVV